MYFIFCFIRQVKWCNISIGKTKLLGCLWIILSLTLNLVGTYNVEYFIHPFLHDLYKYMETVVSRNC